MIIYKLNTIPRYESAVTVVHANEGEYGGQWIFEVVEGDSIFDLSGGSPEVTLNILKADKNVYSNIVENGMDTNRRVVVEIMEQMTAAPGKAVAELVFTRSGEKKATANFIIDVERSPVNMGGQESESLINYVERNRAAAEAATEAAYEAAEATQDAIDAAQAAAESASASAASAASAQQTAESAMDAVENAIENIQGMPQTIQSLASSLSTAGAPHHLLGFNANSNAESFDLGIVTPQMFGAKGNGSTLDSAAFLGAIQSGRKVVVPPGDYRLGSVTWSDDSIVLDDGGTYPEKPFIVSRNIRNSVPYERFIRQFNASDGQAVLHLRGACYDSKRDRIVAAYVTGRNELVEDASSADLIIKVYDTNFYEISGVGTTITGMACVGGICYNSKKDEFCIATGTATAQIAFLDPDTFAVLDTKNWTDQSIDFGCARQIAYDDTNDIYYVVFDNDDTIYTLVIDGDFSRCLRMLLDPRTYLEQANAENLALGGYLIRGGIVYSDQFLQLITTNPDYVSNYGTEGTFICQYNYETEVLKKSYRIGSNYYKGEEPRALVKVNEKIYCLSNIGRTDYRNYVSITELKMDDRVDGEHNSVYQDAKMLGVPLSPQDLNDALSIGCYVSPTTTISTGLSNVPTSYPFVMWVMPVPQTIESRMQVLATYHGEIFIRTYVAHVNIWYDWRQLAETPRKGTTKTGIWDGGGFVTANGTEVRFTIPISLPIESGAVPTIAITSLKVNVRQGGNYLITTDTDIATSEDYVISATPGAFGLGITIRKGSAYANAVNNDACGVGATVTLRFT